MKYRQQGKIYLPEGGLSLGAMATMFEAHEEVLRRIIPTIRGAGNMRLFRAHNGAMVTTAAPVKITTGTAIKTLMQLATPATLEAKIIAWGISFDGSALAVPINCELVVTDVAATVTAYVAADIVKYTDPAALGTNMTLGASASGFTASAEGTITSTQEFDTQLIDPATLYVYQFPLGQEPRLAASKFLRVRVTAPVAVNALCWIVWGEG